MFIDIDYAKKKIKPKIHLAKPNKQIITNLSEKFGSVINLKMGQLNELTFQLPYTIKDETTGKQVKNPNIKRVREKMLIRLTLGTYKEWFIVDSIGENGDDADIFTVTCFSLGFELRRKRISGLEIENDNAENILAVLIADTLWGIGTIDPIFNAMFRSFSSGDDSNSLDGVVEWAKTFGGMLVYDTDSREISLRQVQDLSRYRGLSVTYGRYLQSISRERTTEEMPTRLYVYGSEGLSINSVNPTGMPYIEDFSFYIYPFERDVNRTVLNHSDYMSDELCHALLDHEELIQTNAANISSLTNDLEAERINLITLETDLATLQSELDTILALLDIAHSTQDEQLINQRKQERNAKQSEVDAKQIQVLQKRTDINTLENDLDAIHDTISHQANFTPQLIEELTPFIEEYTWRDDNYLEAQELYDDGLKKFEEMKKPKEVMSISMANLFNVMEEQYYWDKIVVADMVKVKYPQMDIDYMTTIVEIEIVEEDDQANLTMADSNELLDSADRLAQLLEDSKTATTLLQNSKYKWNKVNALEAEVEKMITDVWDANKQKIIAGVNNTIEIGKRGIIVQNPSFPDEIVIVQSGIIALSKDSGETWKTAMTPDGIIAERLIGQIIAGQELLITNSSGHFTMDGNGAIFDVAYFEVRSGTANLVDRWQDGSDFYEGFSDDNVLTPFEKRAMNLRFNDITSRYNSTVSKLSNYYDAQGLQQTFVTDFENAYDDLYDYLFTTVHGTESLPLLHVDNLGSSSTIVGTDLNNKFATYQNALDEVDRQMAIKSVQLAEQALQAAADAQSDVDAVMNDVVYKMEITSSAGLVFRNGQINTTISVKVYRGATDITSTIPTAGFIWSKKDGNGVVDTAWNAAHVGSGSSITITNADIYRSATFDIQIDDGN